MTKELNEFKDLLLQQKIMEKAVLEQRKKKKIADKRMNQFLNRNVFVHEIIVRKVLGGEKILSERIIEALNNNKHLWAKLIIYDYHLQDIYVFGMVKEILNNIDTIVRMVALRQESMIGFVLISLDSELSLERLSKLTVFSK